ncbi:MAG: 30S ribosomal protein S20 [Phycisphaerales bacterium]|nr:MAG: 30S ribosomal protein S20 [Phycisphaerales bacterium]
MAHSNSAKKRVRQNIKRRAINRWRLRSMRMAIKSFETKLTRGSIDEASDALRSVCQIIDKTAQKRVIHANQAARRKSRLNKRFVAAKNAG